MNILGTEITQFPSYVSPTDTPTHMYQDMQETLARRLQTQPMQQQQPAQASSMESTGNQWNQNNENK